MLSQCVACVFSWRRMNMLLKPLGLFTWVKSASLVKIYWEGYMGIKLIWVIDLLTHSLFVLSLRILWMTVFSYFFASIFICVISHALIVFITKFSIVIGSPGAYLSRNRRAITWVSNYRCPIWTFRNCIPVIGYPRDSHVNYARFNGFLRTVSYSFQNLWKALQTFSLKRSSQKTFWIPTFVLDKIN